MAQDSTTRERKRKTMSNQRTSNREAAITAPVQAQEAAVPPLIGQLNNGNWLPQNEAESLRDELYYQRAIHAYMTMQPALNVIGMDLCRRSRATGKSFASAAEKQ